MTLEAWSHGLALVANLAIGVGLVVAVYGLLEQRLFLGAIGGLVLAVAVVWSQATIGEMGAFPSRGREPSPWLRVPVRRLASSGRC